MKQLKYRAWDERNEVMHNDVQLIDSHDQEGWIVIIDLKEKDWDTKLSTNAYFRRQIKVMQGLGLKDSEGKEIFEGDILLSGDDRPKFVRWNESLARYGMSFKTGATTNIPENCLIIGNIHENPQLLQESA